MNTELRKNAKNYFEKDFSKQVNNAVLGKTMEITQRYQTCNNASKKQLFSVRSKLSTKMFSDNLLAIERKRTRIPMIKPVY